MSRIAPLPRRLLVGFVVLGVVVVCDIALFGWLIFRSLSEREISRVLLETREEAEALADQIAGRAEEQGEDLYLAVATEHETQTYIDSILRQRDLVHTVEIRDSEGKLIYRMKSEETLPLGEGGPVTIESPEASAGYEERHTSKTETYDVYDLSVPIAELGEINIGISREEMERRIQVLRQDLLRQAGVVAAVTLALLVSGYLVIWWLLRRGRRLEAKAAESERMAYIGTLAAGLAHEIRNPLNSLSLNMQMLEEDVDCGGEPAAARRILGITRSEIGRLERLVTDFLAYARPRPLERELVPASELARHSRELLGRQARSRSVRLEVEDETDGALVEVDAQQIDQLVMNLVQNAIAASEERLGGGSVVVRAREEGGRVVLEVEDEGSGIPPEDREKIFDVFYSTRKGGTGLGLAIARRIAANHDADLEVGEAPGGGAVIRLWLPLAGRRARVPLSGQAADAPAET